MTGLRRVVSFNNQSAFALPHGSNADKEVDEALASTKQLAIVMVGLPGMYTAFYSRQGILTFMRSLRKEPHSKVCNFVSLTMMPSYISRILTWFFIPL